MSEKVTVKVERNILHLPAIALRGLVVFPNNLLHFEVGRDKSIAAVEWAVRNKSEVFLIAQKDMKAEDPKAEEMYQYGVVAEIKQVMRVSDDLVRILVEGKFRAKRTELDTEGSFLLASVRPAPVRPIKAEEETEAEALLRNVKTSFLTSSRTHSTRVPEKSPQPTPSTCRNLLNMVWMQVNSTDSNLTCPASTQPHKVCAT